MSSIEVKLKYLLRRVRIDINNDYVIPAILNYNYGTFIRARGEILLKYKPQEIGTYDWPSIMKMKDEEFCDYIGCALSELRTLQHDLPFSREYDNFDRVRINPNQ